MEKKINGVWGGRDEAVRKILFEKIRKKEAKNEPGCRKETHSESAGCPFVFGCV